MLDTDGQAVKDWGVYAYPSNFVLDKDGVIRYAYRGALEWDAPKIVNTIKTLL
jgi:peroxiredoxin